MDRRPPRPQAQRLRPRRNQPSRSQSANFANVTTVPSISSSPAARNDKLKNSNVILHVSASTLRDDEEEQRRPRNCAREPHDGGCWPGSRRTQRPGKLFFSVANELEVRTAAETRSLSKSQEEQQVGLYRKF
jgi:hypothetical protein